MGELVRFMRHNSSYHTLLFLSLSLVYYYCCFTSIFLLGSSSSMLQVLAQQINNSISNNKIHLPTEQYTVASSNVNLLTSTIAADKSWPSSSNYSTVTTIANIANTQPPPVKTLKFTIVAGKFWKFNIKADSYSSLSNGELRLYKNISRNNYILDDDNWFQYNHIQQQLFAWPSLSVKPGTYYFVLIPSSGVDAEEDKKNAVNSDVAADIVVELIRPVFQGVNRSDIDILIDHKFTLENLKRQSSFSSTISQALAVFDSLKHPINNNQQLYSSLSGTSTPHPAHVLITNQNFKLANKVRNIVLIDITHHPTEDEFSLTWSTHPAIVNNTITPILECRVAAINETVSRLSSLLIGQRSRDEKFVIYYPISVSVTTTQSIIDTDKGKHTLRLTLNGPCQDEKLVEELANKSNSFFSEKDNNIDDTPSSSTVLTASLQSTSNLNTSNPPALPFPEAVDSATPYRADAVTVASQLQQPQTTVTLVAIPAIQVNQSTQNISEQPPITVAPQQMTTSPATTFSPSSNTRSVLEADLTELQATNSTTDQEVGRTTVLEAQVLKVEAPATPLPEPKVQPQPKSFANFLDSGDAVITHINTMTSSTSMPDIQENSTSSHVELTSTVIYNSSFTSSTPNREDTLRTESSLNEDFIGILNDVMDYLSEMAIQIWVGVGIVLIISVIIAVISLCLKKKKSKQFEVKNRFNFRYGSERKAFLKNSSKPVILDADQKSISMCGTPQHNLTNKTTKKFKTSSYGNITNKDTTSYYPMQMYSSSGNSCDGPVLSTVDTSNNVTCDIGGGYSGGGDCGGNFDG